MALILVFSGEYDVAAKAELRADLNAAKGDPELVLDFSRVGYLDSTVISELFRLKRARDESALPMAAIVVAPQTHLARVLKIAKVDSDFRIVPSLDDAVTAGQRFDVRQAFRPPVLVPTS